MKHHNRKKLLWNFFGYNVRFITNIINNKLNKWKQKKN